MAQSLGSEGVIQVVPPAALEQQLQQQSQAKAAANTPSTPDISPLVGYIRGQYEIFRNHRNTVSGWSNRLLEALRIFNGQYSPSKLAEIKKFGGSTVYARITAQKCRAASSLLRDIYLGQDQPWGLRAPKDPKIPPNILQSVTKLIQSEQQMGQQAGQPIPPDQLDQRKTALLESAKEAAKKKATQQARDSEDKVEQLLRDGGYYHALAEFLVDLPIFVFACIKGPVVKVIPKVTWPPEGGAALVQQTPILTWNRVSPFDLWWTPGVSDIANANMIERLRLSRAEINDLLDLPGYNHDEIRAVLDEYGRGGLYDNWDMTDAERAVLESRENPAWNRSGLISMMEFNGNVQGRVLQEYGLAVPDELRDYNIQAWVIGNHVIKAHLSPSPRQRHPYFITSFEKVPGTPIGNGLSDLLADLQEVANAALRALVNNMSIASGPQVVVNDSRLAPEESGEELYAWKRWHIVDNPLGTNSGDPIKFFMPTSNAQSLIEVFQKFVDIADDVSAIPKYVGGQAGGGAGRTASGLAMLMGNASKILQTVSANVDREVVEQSLLQLFDMILLTDTSGLLTGEEEISVQGVNVAIQRETQRQRQLELLQHTNNPVDQKIMGIRGRANLLRAVSYNVGVDGEEIVPTEQDIDKMVKEEEAQQAQGNQQAIEASVEKGVQRGIEAGVQRIATELTAGALAQRARLPEGAPTHIGTLPQVGSMEDMAAQGQGSQPSPMSQSMGPQTAVVGNQPGPGTKPITGGVG
jgi:hypothetical protein